jgi:tight adherence protein B
MVVDVLAAQLAAGAEPPAAWSATLEVLDLEPGGAGREHPVSWLRRRGPRTSATSAVVAAWKLSDETGAALVGVLAGVAATLREGIEIDAEVQVARAGPHATVRLLTMLPLGGLALGQLIGAEPVRVLLGTGPGRVCGALGVVLMLVGRAWMHRLVAAVGAR